MKKNVYVWAIAAAVLSGALAAFVVTSVPSCNAREGNGLAAASVVNLDREAYPDLTYAAEKAVEAVVNIESRSKVRVAGNSYEDAIAELFGLQPRQREPQERERRAGGSGVAISPDGYIVTNNHVVEGATELIVTLNDKSIHKAKLIGSDAATDLALIKIEADSLAWLPFGNSDDLRLGEWVLAVGNPFNLSSTVTAGIVSAKARSISSIPDQYSVESFIQTDAAVNSGNSGGALVNTRGQLVGINSAIYSPTGTYAGYSFSIPSSIAEKVVADFMKYGVVQRGYLGIQYREINEAFIEQEGERTGITQPGGAYVEQVLEESAAAAAGIKKGDVITKINNTKITSKATVSEVIARFRPGDALKIEVKRNGDVKQFDVVLRNRIGKEELMAGDAVDAVNALGGQFAEISDRIKRDLDIKGGVQVIGVKEDGVLARSRISKGYIITHINGNRINSVADINRITSEIESIDGVYPDGRYVSYSIVKQPSAGAPQGNGH